MLSRFRTKASKSTDRARAKLLAEVTVTASPVSGIGKSDWLAPSFAVRVGDVSCPKFKRPVPTKGSPPWRY